MWNVRLNARMNRNLWLMRHEHWWWQHSCLSESHRTHFRPNQDLSAASYLRRQGSSARLDQLLQTVQIDPALLEAEDASTRKGESAVDCRPQEAGWLVRMHSMRMLLHLVSELLVEQRQVPWTRRLDAGVPMDDRLTRPIRTRASCGIAGSLLCLPLPYHHELHSYLS